MINKFENEYHFLSNFYLLNFLIKDEFGLEYNSTEALYQASKTIIKEEREAFTLANPGLSKKMGRKLKLRSDWEEVKLDVMRNCLKQKFNNPILKQKLLDTGDQELIEGNGWHDSCYGICYCAKCKGVGENWLGKLLMELRKNLTK